MKIFQNRPKRPRYQSYKSPLLLPQTPSPSFQEVIDYQAFPFYSSLVFTRKRLLECLPWPHENQVGGLPLFFLPFFGILAIVRRLRMGLPLFQICFLFFWAPMTPTSHGRHRGLCLVVAKCHHWQLALALLGCLDKKREGGKRTPYFF